jgi:hypothetical protein
MNGLNWSHNARQRPRRVRGTLPCGPAEPRDRPLQARIEGHHQGVIEIDKSVVVAGHLVQHKTVGAIQ